MKFDRLDSSSILSGLQKRPPPVKYGFNHDIFDPHAGSLKEDLFYLLIKINESYDAIFNL
jgi:hypothetical protein